MDYNLGRVQSRLVCSLDDDLGYLLMAVLPASLLGAPMSNPLKWDYGDRAGLRVAAIGGALLGIVTGYSLGHGWFNILIWALIGAVVVSGAAYSYRALR